MKYRTFAMSALSAALGVSAMASTPVVAAEQIMSYSYPKGIVFVGGGPGKGEFAADMPVVTRRTQFAEFGRAGHIEATSRVQYARGNPASVSDSGTEGDVKPLLVKEETRFARPVDRFGRE